MMWDRLFQQMRALEASQNHAHITTSVSRAWPKERVRHTKDQKGERLELSLTGLYGAYGILPDYFTDELLMEGPDREGMRAFLDIFGQRLVMLLYESWSRYRFFTDPALNPQTERAAKEKDFLDRLSGMLAPKDKPFYMTAMRCHKLALYRRRQRTAAGMLELLQIFLPGLKMRMEQFVVSYRKIPQHQFACLGQQMMLGSEGKFVIGERIKDIGGAFRLVFEDLDFDTFMNLSPGGPWRKQLEALVGDYASDTLESHIRLVLRREDVPAWRLGSRSLGRNVWLRSGPITQDQTVDTGVL